MTNRELSDHIVAQWGPDLHLRFLERRCAQLEQERDKAFADRAALARTGAALAHENMRLRLALADRHAPTPEPSPAALDAIRAMQGRGIR